MESHTTLQDVPIPHACSVQPGRPRSALADEAILKAASELLIEVGYQALRMEKVAARAGVSKATLYRRHNDKNALVTAMILATARSSPRDFALPAGSTRQSLEFVLRMAAGAMSQPRWLPIMGAMLSEGAREGGLADIVRAQILDESSALVARLVQSGIARGDLHPGASAEVINDLLFGSVVLRSLLGKEINDEWLDQMLSGVLAGFGVRSAEPPARVAADATTGEQSTAGVHSWE